MYYSLQLGHICLAGPNSYSPSGIENKMLFALVDFTDCDDNDTYPPLVGLTRSQATAREFVLERPAARSAQIFDDPSGDEIRTLKYFLPLECSRGLSQEREISQERELSRELSPEILDLTQEELSPPPQDSSTFNFLPQDFPDTSIQSIILLCDDVLRFIETEPRSADNTTYDVLSHYLTHLEKCTTPILKRFISGIGGRQDPAQSQLLAHLLDGGLVTMDNIQRLHETNVGHGPIDGLLATLLEQMSELQKRAALCIADVM